MKVLGYNRGNVAENRNKNQFINFGRSANFSALQKMNFVTNFMSMHPDRALLKVERSIKGLPENEVAGNPAFKNLVNGLKKFVSTISQSEQEEVSSAVVKSFDIPADSAGEIDIVKDSFRKIVFDSIEEAEKQPENIYKTFILKLTKGLCESPKNTPIVEENFIKAAEPYSKKPVVLLDSQRDYVINKLFCLKGEDLKKQFSEAVELLPPVEAETEIHLKSANQFFRNLSERLSQEDYPHLALITSDLLPGFTNQTIDQKLFNIMVKFNNNEEYAPFYRKLTESLLVKDTAALPLVEEVAKKAEPKTVVKSAKKGKSMSPAKKEFADKKLKLLLEGVLVDIEKIKLEIRKNAISIKRYNSQISRAQKEMDRLNGLREFRKVNSETYRAEAKRQEYLEKIEALESTISKRRATVNKSRYENLVSQHGDSQISDKRIRNKIKRYENSLNSSDNNTSENELALLKKEYAQFNKNNPSIDYLNKRIALIQKLLDFNSYYEKTYAELSRPSILSQSDKLEIQALGAKLSRLTEETNKLEPTYQVLRVIDNQPRMVKVDYDAKIAQLKEGKPNKQHFSTQQGFQKAMYNWNLKMDAASADRNLAKEYLENKAEMAELSLRMDNISGNKVLSKEKQVALQKLELQKKNVERYLSAVDTSTSKTGKEKLEQELGSLKSKLEDKLGGLQNENGAFISGMKNIWDLDNEISNLKMKSDIMIARANAQKQKQSKNLRHKTRLESFLRHKAGGKDDIYKAAKEEVARMVSFDKNLEIDDLETFLSSAAKEIKEQKLILLGKIKKNSAKNVENDDDFVNPFRLTRAQKQKLERIEGEHNTYMDKTSNMLNQRKHCQFLLSGGNLEDYGLVPKSAKHDSEKLEHPGYWNMLEDLQEKLETVTGEEHKVISAQIDELKHEISEIENFLKDVTSNLDKHTKQETEIRKKIDVVKYNLQV